MKHTFLAKRDASLPDRPASNSSRQESLKTVAGRGPLATKSDDLWFVLRVGTELRITNEGEVILSDPDLELVREEFRGEAARGYRFDPKAGEHTGRLLDPLADRRHAKVQRLDE